MLLGYISYKGKNKVRRKTPRETEGIHLDKGKKRNKEERKMIKRSYRCVCVCVFPFFVGPRELSLTSSDRKAKSSD